MRAVLLAGVAVVALGTASRANVIYEFDPAVVSILYPERTPYPSLYGYEAGFSVELTDAAISRGSFSINGSVGSGPTSFRGDVADLVRFTGPEISFSPTSNTAGFGRLDLSMTFDAYGNVLTGSLFHRSYDEELSFDITNNYVSGVWTSEYPACWYGCSEEGALLIYNVPAASNVPEPASLALLGMGLTGVVVARRRRG